MTKSEWAAVYTYCEEYGCTKAELLRELKNNGSIAREDSLEDLGGYVREHTYDNMIRFLEDNI